MFTPQSLNLAVVAIFLSFLVGCGSNQSADKVATLSESTSVSAKEATADVIVTSEYLRHIAQSLVQKQLTVRRIIPSGVLSTEWRPRRADIHLMQNAKLIALSGAGFEPWQDRVSLPDSRVIDTSIGYSEQLIRIPDAVIHQHGPDGAHSHAGTVWVTWLDPALADAQLSELARAIGKTFPDFEPTIIRESAAMKAQLETIGRNLDDLKSRCASLNPIFAADTAASMYLTRRLGAELRYLHWQKPEAPTDGDKEELNQLSAELAKSPQPRLFLLNQRCPNTAEEWCRLHGFEVVRIDLLDISDSTESKEGDTNIISRMRHNVERLNSALDQVKAQQ